MATATLEAERDLELGTGKVNLQELVIATALRDKRFLQALLRDVKAALREWRFVDLPDEVEIRVHRDRESVVNLVVPYVPDDLPVDELSDTELLEAVGIGAVASRTTGSEVQRCCSNANCC
jgi:hypothetical protein